MANDELITAIKNSGVKKSYICKKLEISHTSLENKLSGRSRFYADEAVIILQLLGLNEADFSYFFARKVK